MFGNALYIKIETVSAYNQNAETVFLTNIGCYLCFHLYEVVLS
ncbi:hypothetical protein HMPREF0645_2005 [Hallella bergensis DSM 17361]|uniref:Uncharacterized protein n=1 Tax=Hallella bergensis DSM 17361 TaxID=585502 RepID=D1PYH0_9BACT|nr:hypothetical protein HMPREF0645_2005 [Hallella bergensis DSM 17361]